MARKHLWTIDKLKEMSEEINKKMSEDPKYNAKQYAQENNIVYGTLYQALRRNGLFNPSRVRKVKVNNGIPAIVVDTDNLPVDENSSREVEQEVLDELDKPTPAE
jgi:hypothetical protein